jgi:hypothetical protein
VTTRAVKVAKERARMGRCGTDNIEERKEAPSVMVVTSIALAARL